MKTEQHGEQYLTKRCQTARLNDTSSNILTNYSFLTSFVLGYQSGSAYAKQTYTFMLHQRYVYPSTYP